MKKIRAFPKNIVLEIRIQSSDNWITKNIEEHSSTKV